MQSPSQSDSGPNPMTTATSERRLDIEPGAPAVQSGPDPPEGEIKSAAPTETETPTTQQENRTLIETPASMPVTQAAENEPAVPPQAQYSDTAGLMELDSASKPSVPTDPGPDINSDPRHDRPNAKKQEKGVSSVRRYIPSKKAMIDPLKIEMSELDMALSCEYFTLYVPYICYLMSNGHVLQCRGGFYGSVNIQMNTRM